jgi:metal-sulfur cluster biosynthetic enzyme
MHPAVSAASLTEGDILAALRDCYDAAVPLYIVDLGVVHCVSIDPDPDAPGAGIPGVPPRHRVHVELTLAQIADPESDGAALVAQIQNRLAAFETISRTAVSLLAEPAWNPGRISPEGRARLSNPFDSRKPAHGLIQIKT